MKPRTKLRRRRAPSVPRYHVIDEPIAGPAERELVSLLSLSPVGEHRATRIRKLLTAGVRFDQVRAIAKAWRVEPAAFENLRVGFASFLPRSDLESFAQLEKVERVKSIARAGETLAVIRALQGKGIGALPIKGAALGQQAYGDVSRRGAGDVDVLVRKADVRKARDVVLGLGYSPLFSAAVEERAISGGHALKFAGESTYVELHWSLLPRHLSLEMDTELVWRSSAQGSESSQWFSLFAYDYLFVYLCAHGAKHRWEQLRWVVDIAQLMGKLDAREALQVVSLAEDLHLERVLALGIRAVSDIYPDAINPFPPLSELRSRETNLLARRVSRHFSGLPAPISSLEQRLRKSHFYFNTFSFWLRGRERAVDKVSCISRFLLEPAPNDTGTLRALVRLPRIAAGLIKGLM